MHLKSLFACVVLLGVLWCCAQLVSWGDVAIAVGSVDGSLDNGSAPNAAPIASMSAFGIWSVELQRRGRINLRTQRSPVDLFADNWLWSEQPMFYHLKSRKDSMYAQAVAPCGRPCFNFVGGWPLVKFTRAQQPCVAYSFGVGGNYEFEAYIVSQWHCAVHAFDPTRELRELHERSKPAGVVFHYKGLRGRHALPSQTVVNSYGSIDMSILSDLPFLLAENNHRYVDVLKIDCEGCEWAVFNSLDAEWLGRHVQKLLVEVHFRGAYPTKQQLRKFWNVTLQSFRLAYRHLVVKKQFSTMWMQTAAGGDEVLMMDNASGTFVEYAFENMNVGYARRNL